MMNLLHLEYFYRVAQESNVSRAAQKLRVSQPAVSRALRELESAHEVKLFRRQSRGLVLTEVGQAFYEQAKTIFQKVSELENSVGTIKTEVKGSLRLGISDNLAIYFFPDIFQSFLKTYPQVHLSVFSGISSAIKRELLLNQVEAGIFYTPISRYENFESEILGQVEFVLVVSKKCFHQKDLRTLHSQKLSLEVFKKLKIPKISSRASDYRLEGEAPMKTLSLPVHFKLLELGLADIPEIETNHHEVQKQLVLKGLGFAMLTRHAVQKELDSGELVQVKTAKKMLSNVYWVTQKGHSLSRSAEIIKNEVRLRLKSLKV
jgi:DNA-binding transcriptional LysR family regulator